MTMAPNMYHWISSQAFELKLKSVAEEGVAGADDAGKQHQPVADVPDLFVECVDERAEGQQKAHPSPLCEFLLSAPCSRQQGAFS